jgi:hypothetical protein
VEVLMRVGVDEFWKLSPGVEVEDKHPERLSPRQTWWVIGPDEEVLGKLAGEFSDEELVLLFQ